MTHSAVLPSTLWFTRCPVPTATGIAADRHWLSEEFAPDGIEVRSLQDAAPTRTAPPTTPTHCRVCSVKAATSLPSGHVREGRRPG